MRNESRRLGFRFESLDRRKGVSQHKILNLVRACARRFSECDVWCLQHGQTYKAGNFSIQNGSDVVSHECLKPYANHATVPAWPCSSMIASCTDHTFDS